MFNRENKIANELTAKVVVAGRMNSGYRLLKRHLIIWSEGRTNHVAAVMSQLSQIGKASVSGAEDIRTDCPALKASNTYGNVGPTFRGTDKAIYAVSEIWILRDAIDEVAAISWLESKRIRPSSPTGRK